MRIFVALNLPAAERRRIHRAVQVLRDGDLPVRWLEPDHFHLTLKFLGEVRPERVPEVEAILGRVAADNAPLTLELGGFGAFPTPRRPRVLWVGVLASPALRCLKQDLEWALADAGFEPETRDFHPHLTVGRADPGDRAGAFRDLDARAVELDLCARVPVPTIDLMRSQLSREGAHYTVLFSARFEGA